MYSKRFYIFCRTIIKIFYSPFKRIIIFGNRNIDRPSIIICNHISLDDPLILAHVFKTEPKYLSKKELFENKIFSWFLLKLGCISVNRQAPDLKSMRSCIECINNGQSLVVFPEGKRNRGIRCKKEDAKGGIGLIAASTKADILPVSIYTKDYRSSIFKKTYVTIGKSISYNEYINACEDKRDIGVYAFEVVEKQLIDLEASFEQSK